MYMHTYITVPTYATIAIWVAFIMRAITDLTSEISRVGLEPQRVVRTYNITMATESLSNTRNNAENFYGNKILR